MGTKATASVIVAPRALRATGGPGTLVTTRFTSG